MISNVPVSYRQLLSDAREDGLHHPPLHEIYSDPPGWLIAMWVVGGACCLAYFIDFGFHLYAHLTSPCRTQILRTYTMRILAVLPLATGFAYFGLLIPQSNGITELLAGIYEILCMYWYLKVLESLFGGRNEMISALEKSPAGRHFAFPPCCCCYICFYRKAKVSRKEFGILKVVLIAACCVRGACLLITAVLSLLNNRILKNKISNLPFIFLTLFSIISMMTMVWVLFIHVHMSKVPLKKWYPRRKFVSLKLVLVVGVIMKVVFAILQRLNVYEGAYVYTAEGQQENFTNFAIIIVLLPVMALFRVAFSVKHYSYELVDIENPSLFDINSDHNLQNVEDMEDNHRHKSDQTTRSTTPVSDDPILSEPTSLSMMQSKK